MEERAVTMGRSALIVAAYCGNVEVGNTCVQASVRSDSQSAEGSTNL